VRQFSRGNRAYQRRDRPRGKTPQRGKASRRRHDEEVLRTDLNANSLVAGAFFPFSLPILLPLDQKSHDETDRARFSLREDENAIERDRNRVGLLLLFLSLPIPMFLRILFICARTAYCLSWIGHVCSYFRRYE